MGLKKGEFMKIITNLNTILKKGEFQKISISLKSIKLHLKKVFLKTIKKLKIMKNTTKFTQMK